MLDSSFILLNSSKLLLKHKKIIPYIDWHVNSFKGNYYINLLTKNLPVVLMCQMFQYAKY